MTKRRIFWDILLGISLTILAIVIMNNFSPELTRSMNICLGIYLFLIHSLLVNNVYNVLFGYRAEHNHLLRELETRFSAPILVERAIDPRAQNAYKLFERIGSLEEKKWIALKFIAFNSIRTYPNGSKVEMPLQLGDYSRLLNILLEECKKSVYWVGIISPHEYEAKKIGGYIIEHSQALYQARIDTKVRIFILERNEYDSLMASKIFLNKFIGDNHAGNVRLIWAVKEEVEEHFDGILVEDFGVYDEKIAVQWTGNKRKIGRLIIGDDVNEMYRGIQNALNDTTGVFHKLKYEANTKRFERVKLSDL